MVLFMILNKHMLQTNKIHHFNCVTGLPMLAPKSVHMIVTSPPYYATFKEAHYAVFPEELIVDCIKAGCPVGGVVLDMFMGRGTTAVVAIKQNRNFIGFEQSGKNIKTSERYMRKELGLFTPQDTEPDIPAPGFKNGITDNMISQVMAQFEA